MTRRTHVTSISIKAVNQSTRGRRGTLADRNGRSRARDDRVPFLGQAAAAKGRDRRVLTKELRVHLAVPGHAHGEACHGCPPSTGWLAQYAKAGGELLVCPICVHTRGPDSTKFATNATVAGATPPWEWSGDEAATIFSH